jgi:hypothetical protein
MLKSLSILFWLQLVLSGLAFGNAFQTSAPLALKSARSQPWSYEAVDIAAPTFETTSLLAAKKKNDDNTQKEKLSALTIFIAFATPWRNPNSIFVYLFLGVYALGKYSEATHGGG